MAVFLENRPEYVGLLLGLSKVPLANTNMKILVCHSHPLVTELTCCLFNIVNMLIYVVLLIYVVMLIYVYMLTYVLSC